MRGYTSVLTLAGAAAVLLLLWQLAAMLLNRYILPPPSDVFSFIFAHLLDAAAGQYSLWQHTLVSTWRVTAGIIISVIAAAPLGLLLGQNRTLLRLSAPFIYITYPIPKVVFLPILAVTLGIGDATKIFLIAIVLFFQVLVLVRDAAAAVRGELIYSVRSLGAGWLGILRYVYVPATLPAVLTSLRLSVGTAIAVLYLTETFATQIGLGYYIQTEFGIDEYVQVYAGVVMMSALGLTYYFLLDAAERRLAGWQKQG